MLRKTVEEKGESVQLVRERSAGPNIIETKHIVLTQVKNTIKNQVVTEQFYKVTTREGKRPLKI